MASDVRISQARFPGEMQRKKLAQSGESERCFLPLVSRVKMELNSDPFPHTRGRAPLAPPAQTE